MKYVERAQGQRGKPVQNDPDCGPGNDVSDKPLLGEPVGAYSKDVFVLGSDSVASGNECPSVACDTDALVLSAGGDVERDSHRRDDRLTAFVDKFQPEVCEHPGDVGVFFFAAVISSFFFEHGDGVDEEASGTQIDFLFAGHGVGDLP